MTKLTGRLDDDRRTLVLTRQFDVPAERLWTDFTDPDRLERWFGAWTGDPASGQVMLTMNAEAESVPAVPCRILHCDRPRRLSVTVTDSFGTWQLAIGIDEDEGSTRLTLRHEEVDLQTVPEVGPGWEWYLDRLTAAVAGEAPPTLEDFVDTYAPMGQDYAVMISGS